MCIRDRVSTILITAIIAALVSWILGRWWLGAGNGPVQVGWFVGLLLIGMAVVVLGAGLRMWRMRSGRTHVPPLVAARLLGLAQASALTGAITGGIYVGLALVLLPDIGFAERGAMALRLGFAALGATAITVAGLVVQHWCRVDDEDDDDDDPPEGRG